jgi:hypothetical protein
MFSNEKHFKKQQLSIPNILLKHLIKRFRIMLGVVLMNNKKLK